MRKADMAGDHIKDIHPINHVHAIFCKIPKIVLKADICEGIQCLKSGTFCPDQFVLALAQCLESEGKRS